MANCKAMDVWLIDRYFQSPKAAGTPTAARHREIAGLEHMTGTKQRQSRWNAGWSIHDPMLKRGEVDTSDIETIEVLKIPLYLPIDEPTCDKLIESFLRSVPRR